MQLHPCWTRTGTWLCRVVGKEHVRKQGLFNPYTFASTIVVNGVAASTHSEWALDGVFDMVGRPDLLPTVYEVLLAVPLHEPLR